MAYVKGPNGQVIDVLDAVASGLVGGGHAKYVNADGSPSDVPVEEAADSKDAKTAKG